MYFVINEHIEQCFFAFFLSLCPLVCVHFKITGSFLINFDKMIMLKMK